jgi:hypothetical protein
MRCCINVIYVLLIFWYVANKSKRVKMRLLFFTWSAMFAFTNAYNMQKEYTEISKNWCFGQISHFFIRLFTWFFQCTVFLHKVPFFCIKWLNKIQISYSLSPSFFSFKFKFSLLFIHSSSFSYLSDFLHVFSSLFFLSLLIILIVI